MVRGLLIIYPNPPFLLSPPESEGFMRNRKKVIALTALLLALISAFIAPVYADTPFVGAHPLASVGYTPFPTPLSSINNPKTNRERVLSQFLSRYNSPLRREAVHFIKTADRYNLDWRLLPAIAGMESTFGKFLLEGTYNPFGWGGGYIYFDNFEDAIETVGRQLFLRFNGRTTPEDIGPTYTPPNYVNWIRGVNYFMREMGKMEKSWGELPVPVL